MREKSFSKQIIMRKIYLIILITSLYVNMYSQHLTLNNLDYLHKNNIEECDALLTQKGFVYDESEKVGDKIRTLWYYKKNDSNGTISNEYVYKYCNDKVFNQDCDLIQYIFSNTSHFNTIKENIKKNNLAKFLYSDTSPENGLNFYYLYPGPKELRFVSIPHAATKAKTYAIMLKKMSVTLED